MKNLKSIIIAGMIGAGSLIGFNGYGQETINAIENAFKRDEILDSVTSIVNSMISHYNQCVANGTKSNKDKCEKIFLPKLAKCDSLLKKFKSLPVEDDYYSVEQGLVFDYGQVPFTNESADSLIRANKRFYDATEFLINNPSQKNYDAWRNKLEVHKKSCAAVFNQ